jgi:chemotaxis protein CheD
MCDIFRVGMADAKVCKAPDKLTTLGLGSCVGVVVYDEERSIAGLAHIMLPDSNSIRQNSNKYKFADTGIEKLVEMLIYKGAGRNNLKAKLAGGAQMFKFMSDSDSMKIGERNVLAVQEKLASLSIPVISSDTGGNYGRSIEFDIATSELTIKAIGHEIRVI